MEFKTYVKGKSSIEATETAYEVLYKQQGYKPVADDGKPADDGGKGKKEGQVTDNG